MEIVEATSAEAAWAAWAMSCDVDTGGRCTCGHEGLGIDWHVGGCPGAEHALRRKLLTSLDLIANLEEAITLIYDRKESQVATTNDGNLSAYVRLTREPVMRTITADTGVGGVDDGPTVNVDVDSAGRMVGIEVVGAVEVEVEGQTIR